MHGGKNAKLHGHTSLSGTARWVVILVLKCALNFGRFSHLTGCQSVRHIALYSGFCGVTPCSLVYRNSTRISE
jgi:hypothetical protein